MIQRMANFRPALPFNCGEGWREWQVGLYDMPHCNPTVKLQSGTYLSTTGTAQPPDEGSGIGC